MIYTIVWLIVSLPALAHAPNGAPWQSLTDVWKWDPFIITSLLIIAIVYTGGIRRLWKRQIGHRISVRRVGSFYVSMLVLVMALLSPIDAISAELNWMHMIQHMLIMNVAAPLFVVAAPAYALQRSMPFAIRQRLGFFYRQLVGWQAARYYLWQPIFLWTAYGLVLWVWHLPPLYESALHNQTIHDFQHIMFFCVSCLFWRILLDPIARLKVNRGLGIIYLFATSLHATLLGVFMALSPRLWYETYAESTRRWGVSALEDQQLAGLIMWMPACMIYAIFAAWLFGVWLLDTEARQSHTSREVHL